MKLFDMNGQINLDTTDVYINGQKSDLNICQISNEEYAKLVETNSCQPNTLYLVDTDDIDARGQRIVNVAEPKDGNDVVTLDYLRSCLSAMQSDLKSQGNSFDESKVKALVKEALKEIIANL